MAIRQPAAEQLCRERDQRRVRVPGTAGVKPPPLESGDRLTRREFERRYKAMPHVKKAELIEGVVYMPAPVSASHGQAHGSIMVWPSCSTAWKQKSTPFSSIV